MNLDLVILTVSSVAIALLGLIVFVRNPADLGGKRFAAFSLSIIAWVVFNYLSDYAQIHDLLFTRLVFVGGVFSIVSLLLFIYDFPEKFLFKSKFVLFPHLFISAALLPFIFTPYFIESVGEESINTGSFYSVFIVYVAYSLLLYGVVAYRQFVRAANRGQKRQVAIVFGSIALYAMLTVTSNVLIPLLADDWSSSRFGPVFSLIFVAAVAYSIVKYRLFDIKFLVLRSLGYVLSLVALALLSFISLTWLSKVFDRLDASVAIRIDAFALVTILLALAYQPFKRVFERITNKIFYKDAYDTRALLDEFNGAIVLTIALDELLQHSSTTIEKYIKSQNVSYVIRDEQRGLRIISEKASVNKSLIEHVDSYLRANSETALVTDMLEDDLTLKRLLQRADVGIIARMVIGKMASGRGYIVLGYKKSGDSYSPQDKEAMKILANGLSIAVQNALRFEEIEQFNVKLKQEVEEATKKLRRTNERLRVLDQTKDDFISMASHQLRTPLTSVKGYVSMVLDGDAGRITALQRKLLNQSFISSQRMVYLISDLLNVSRLKTGKFIIENAPTNLAKVIEEEVEQLIETVKGRNLELNYHKPEHFPTLMLDETKIRQVLMNFIDNAVYYTPSGGHIDVYLEEKPKSIEFRVVDDGIGVPKHEQHHLFTKFYRAHNAKRARPDGTGLGIFMAKKVVIAQGGAVIFKSQEGKGSTFGFTFPKHTLLAPEKAPEKSQNKQETEKITVKKT